MDDYVYQEWPKWLYDPNGESAVFEEWEDIPAGWTDNPNGKETPDEEDAPEARQAPDEAGEEVQVAPRPRGRPRKNTEHQF